MPMERNHDYENAATADFSKEKSAAKRISVGFVCIRHLDRNKPCRTSSNWLTSPQSVDLSYALPIQTRWRHGLARRSLTLPHHPQPLDSRPWLASRLWAHGGRTATTGRSHSGLACIGISRLQPDDPSQGACPAVCRSGSSTGPARGCHQLHRGPKRWAIDGLQP